MTMIDRPKDSRKGGKHAPLRSRVKTPIATMATNARVIPVDSIVVDPDQPRREPDPEALERLAESLIKHGQLQSIRVRWDPAPLKYVIVCGERRWRAAIIAGLPTLVCLVEDGTPLPTSLLVKQLVENCCREDLAPLDQAIAMRTLVDEMAWSHEQLAAELGLSRSAVSRSLAFLEFPPSVRDLVTDGMLSHSAARALNRLEDKALVERLAEDAVKQNWTRSQAEAAARSRGAPLDPIDEPASDNIGSPCAALSDAAPLVLPPPADYRVRCNGCGYTKMRSEPGLCPEGHTAGWSYAEPEPEPEIEEEEAGEGEGSDDVAEDDEQPSKFLVRTSKGAALYCLTGFDLAEVEAWAKSNHPADWGGSVVPISEEDWAKLPKWIGTRPARGGPSLIHVQEGAKSWRDIPISDPAFSVDLTDLLFDSEIESAGEAWDLLESGSLTSVHEWTPDEAKGLESALVLLRMKAGDPAPCTEPNPPSFQVAKGITIVPTATPAVGEGLDVPRPAPKVPPTPPPPPPRAKQLVFGFTSDEQFEIVITRSKPWTGQEILAAVWELKVKLERQYFKPEGGKP